jgi:hypothetical protein
MGRKAKGRKVQRRRKRRRCGGGGGQSTLARRLNPNVATSLARLQCRARTSPPDHRHPAPASLSAQASAPSIFSRHHVTQRLCNPLRLRRNSAHGPSVRRPHPHRTSPTPPQSALRTTPPPQTRKKTPTPPKKTKNLLSISSPATKNPKKMNVSRIVAGIVSQFMVETIWLG